MIRGEHIFLRALEPGDLAFLAQIENDARLWQVGELHQPLSQYTLEAYLENAHQPLAEAGQLRLGICTTPGVMIGLVDLFNYDAMHHRAGVSAWQVLTLSPINVCPSSQAYVATS